MSVEDNRDNADYRREVERLRAALADPGRAALARAATVEAWIEFGKHNWVWQMFHRKPRA